MPSPPEPPGGLSPPEEDTRSGAGRPATAVPGVPFRGRPAGLRYLLPLIPLLAIGIPWQLYALNVRQTWALPTATATFAALIRLLLSPQVWSGLGHSAVALLVGFLVAAVAGLALGLLLGAASVLERFIDIYLTMALVAPTAALVPVVVVVFGLGTTASATVVFIFAFVYVVVNTVVGVRTADRRLREMAVSFGATPWQVYRRIVLPHAVPEIMAGMRLGLGHGIIGMIVAEFELVTVGIGRLIDEYSSNFEAARLFALIIILLGLGALLLSLLERAERTMTAWKQRA